MNESSNKQRQKSTLAVEPDEQRRRAKHELICPGLEAASWHKQGD
jgi:hypothetical protein